jgi:predicted site-specific integrase-resolvase
MATPEAFTEEQAARILGVNARTLRRWRKAGAVGHYLTPGGRIRYAPEHLHRLLANMEVAPALGLTKPSMA